jgi:hypothetical protein
MRNCDLTSSAAPMASLPVARLVHGIPIVDLAPCMVWVKRPHMVAAIILSAVRRLIPARLRIDRVGPTPGPEE